MTNTNLLLVGVFSLLLIILQVVFGFLMRKNRKAFLKYHRILGVIIFLVALLNVIVFPQVLVIGIITLLAILGQIIIGIFLVKNIKLLKYHKPLGISILILIVANLVLALT